MKIVHLCSTSVYSGPLPGALGLAAAQAALGHDVWFAYDRLRGAFSPYEEAYDERTRPLPGHGAPCRALALAPRGGPLRLLGDLVRLGGWLRRSGVDVVHAHLTHDHVLARLARPRGAALVRTLHSRRARQRRLGARWLFAGTDGAILRERSAAEEMARAFGRASAPASRCLAGGLPLDAWQPPCTKERVDARLALRQRLALSPEAKVLLHVALLRDRGQKQLIEAAAALNAGAYGAAAPHVAFVGLGPAEASLRAQAAASPARDRVHFLGYHEQPALRRLYAGADGAFLAVPGNDGAARAALEAMAMALPVVALAGRGLEAALPELDADTGFWAHGGGADAIARALGAWQACRRREALGRRASDRVHRRRSFAAEARATLRFYAERLEVRRQHRYLRPVGA